MPLQSGYRHFIDPVKRFPRFHNSSSRFKPQHPFTNIRRCFQRSFVGLSCRVGFERQSIRRHSSYRSTQIAKLTQALPESQPNQHAQFKCFYKFWKQSFVEVGISRQPLDRSSIRRRNSSSAAEKFTRVEFGDECTNSNTEFRSIQPTPISGQFEFGAESGKCICVTI